MVLVQGECPSGLFKSLGKEKNMSYLVTVTFDLNQADPSVYPKVHFELENIDFSKLITRRKKIDKPLPSNTFIAEFDDDDFDRSHEVCSYVSDELNRIFKKYDVVGRYFVASGKKWAWKMGNAG